MRGKETATFLLAATVPTDKRKTTIPLRNCRLWSPEDPFLYELEVRGEADVLKTRFGMRSFRLDRRTGWANLNGRPYFMRGSNLTVYRFFEDSQRGDKPWREEWVRRLHQACRDMHWNCLRYCIGFPPESWYRIADEEGFLIQDEFPIWNGWHKSGLYDVGELVREYTEWMQDRWNHPCVVIWDACNETILAETGKAIRAVRGLDLSGRPWDNGWGTPQSRGTRSSRIPTRSSISSRPAICRCSARSTPPGQPGSMSGSAQMNKGNNPVIVNEYNSMFLTRDGTPTPGSKKVYEDLIGPDSTIQQRRVLCARLLAAQTEFWRCHRKCAAVMQFCAFGLLETRWRNQRQLDGRGETHLGAAVLPVRPRRLRSGGIDDRRLGGRLSAGPRPGVPRGRHQRPVRELEGGGPLSIALRR